MREKLVTFAADVGIAFLIFVMLASVIFFSKSQASEFIYMAF